MKFIKKRNQYEASNVSFDPESVTAYSYNWWKFVSVINGKVVFNNYNYSPSTCKHQSKVRRLLETLNIKIDFVVSSPKGLQSGEWADSAISELEYKIEELKDALSNPRRRKALDEQRNNSIVALQEEIFQVRKVELGDSLSAALS